MVDRCFVFFFERGVFIHSVASVYVCCLRRVRGQYYNTDSWQENIHDSENSASRARDLRKEHAWWWLPTYSWARDWTKCPSQKEGTT